MFQILHKFIWHKLKNADLVKLALYPNICIEIPVLFLLASGLHYLMCAHLVLLDFSVHVNVIHMGLVYEGSGEV